MKQLFYTLVTMLICLFSTYTICRAGNIPQYKYEKGNALYAEITDGTAVTSAWNGYTTIFADGMETDNPYTGPGFPIGFDFKFGGRTFNQFAVCNAGVIYFGENAVTFNGRSSFYFAPVQGGMTGSKPNSDFYNTFYTGMAPIAYGIYKGNISYKTYGEAGEKVCTVQFKNMILNENGSKGQYCLQIRLYQKDNRVEMAFKEIETCYGGMGGFYTGIRGWNDDDTMLLNGTGIDAENVGVSSIRTGSMLEPKSYIDWDEEDYGRNIQAVYSFTPQNNPAAPEAVPANLTVTEKGGSLDIAFDKGEGADATVLLYATAPITEADLPADGQTFDVGKTFGNSTILYYGDKEHVSAALKGTTSSTSYYIRAFSANGTPVFNRTRFAEVIYTTTQTSPEAFSVTAVDTATLHLEWTAAYPVIIAMNDSCPAISGTGYMGVFGQPLANAEVGDEMPEGGKIIYKGDASEFTLKSERNQIRYFRIWTVNGDKVSTTAKDAYGIPFTSLPYQPRVESYPIGITPEGWTSEGGEKGFVPGFREYDHVPALRGSSSEGGIVTLTTPALPLELTSQLTFEFSLETIILGDGKVSKGYMAGVFGQGHALVVSAGENTGKEQVLKTVSTYEGTMAPAGEEGYQTGSSTFQTVTVDLPRLTATSRINISFSTEVYSQLFLRNILLQDRETAIGKIETDCSGNTVYGGKGIIHILPAKDGTVNLYSIDGRKITTVPVQADVETSLPAKAGVYLVNGQKVMVK